MPCLARWLVVVLAFVVACTGPDAPSPADGSRERPRSDSLAIDDAGADSLAFDGDADRSMICRGIDNSFECAQAVERARLAVPGAAAYRRDDRLLIRLGRGDTLMLTNSPDSAGVAGASYSYVAHLRAVAHHLVEIQYYEGRAFLLISDRSGRRTVISGYPVISPDSSRIVTASVDLEAGYDPTEIAIWRVSADSLLPEWRLDPRTLAAGPESAWGPADAEWITPTEIRVRKEYRSGRRGGTAVIRLEPGGWVLSDEG
jgi:hypothetical protein